MVLSFYIYNNRNSDRSFQWPFISVVIQLPTLVNHEDQIQMQIRSQVAPWTVWWLFRSLTKTEVFWSLISVAKLHFSNNVLLGLVPYKFVGCDFVGRAGVHTKGQGRKWRKNGSKLVRHKKHAYNNQGHTRDSKNSINFVFYFQRSYRGCWISRSITKIW